MTRSPLPFAPPDLGDEEIAEVAEAIRSGWITTGPRTAAFEEAFARAVGAPAALAVSSGTAALHVALLALGLGPGDGVIVSTMTFASAAHVVEHVGARPILVDVEPETLNLDLSEVERALDGADSLVRCVLPVHLWGQPCDLPALLELAERRDLSIVDDAAHALPALIDGIPIGGSRDPRVLTAFSFYATKNLATGEGGMLTGSRDLLDEARGWTLHGMSKDAWRRHEPGAAWRYDVDRAGFKYNLSDIQSAMGLVQLRRLEAMTKRRRQVARRYLEGLSETEEVQLPTVRPGSEVSWHIFAIRLRLDQLRVSRDRFMHELGLRGVSTSVHFIPVHSFSYYRGRYDFQDEDFPVASREFQRLVSLPIHPRMSDDDVDHVIESVSDVVANFRR